jgi:hypothetical protein
MGRRCGKCEIVNEDVFYSNGSGICYSCYNHDKKIALCHHCGKNKKCLSVSQNYVCSTCYQIYPFYQEGPSDERSFPSRERGLYN